MKELAKYKNILVALTIIFIFVLINYNIFSHYWENLESLKVKEKDLEKAKETIGEFERLDKIYNQIREEFLEKDTLLFKKFVEEEARTAEINITSLTMSPTDKDFYWQVAIELEATSGYENFVNFSNLLKKKMLEMERLRIVRVGNETTIEATLRGIVLK